MSRFLLALSLLLPLAAGATTFRNPFNPTQCGWAGGCYITAYFDLNRASGTVRDWSCGTHTYDNHAGTDMGVGSWTGMDQGRDVLAAADGVVIGVHDGEFDRCTSGACGAANYVWLRHADNKVTLYYHLKKNSVVVSNGQTVTCGQKLGQVGSSGYSTGPHLHFQVNAVNGDPNSYDDPFAGAGGCGGSLSWWVSQGGYKSLPGYACEPRPMPEVHVTSIALSPASPTEGDAVQLSAVVRNTGDASTGEVVGVGFFVDGAAITWGIVPALAAGATATVTSEANWTAVAGAHEILAFADDVNRFAEKDENNNKLTKGVTVAALPDLTISELTWSPPAPIEGEAVSFTALVENTRGPSDQGFDVAFHIGDTVVATGLASALGAGGSAAVTASAEWTAVRGAHTVRATSDAAGAVREFDEANNGLSRELEILARDEDGDGSRADLDCDEGDATVHPEAEERCNGRDDNCDGESDEGLDCTEESTDAGVPVGSTPAGPAATPGEQGNVIEAEAGGCGCTSASATSLLPLLSLLMFGLLRSARSPR